MPRKSKGPTEVVRIPGKPGRPQKSPIIPIQKAADYVQLGTRISEAQKIRTHLHDEIVHLISEGYISSVKSPWILYVQKEDDCVDWQEVTIRLLKQMYGEMGWETHLLAIKNEPRTQHTALRSKPNPLYRVNTTEAEAA